MANDNQLPVLRELIELHTELAPQLEQFDALKKLVREFGPGEYGVPNLGTVKVSEPSVVKPKGTVLKVNLEVFNQLPPAMKAELIEKGVIHDEIQYTQARASSVSVSAFN